MLKKKPLPPYEPSKENVALLKKAKKDKEMRDKEIRSQLKRKDSNASDIDILLSDSEDDFK